MLNNRITLLFNLNRECFQRHNWLKHENDDIVIIMLLKLLLCVIIHQTCHRKPATETHDAHII